MARRTPRDPRTSPAPETTPATQPEGSPAGAVNQQPNQPLPSDESQDQTLDNAAEPEVQTAPKAPDVEIVGEPTEPMSVEQIIAYMATKPQVEREYLNLKNRGLVADPSATEDALRYRGYLV